MPTNLAQHIQSTPFSRYTRTLTARTRLARKWSRHLTRPFRQLCARRHQHGGGIARSNESPDRWERLRYRRFEGIREAWEATQFTGYGEAVRLIAKHAYDLDELTEEKTRISTRKIPTSCAARANAIGYSTT